MISYAQNFEDVILNRVFSGKNSGFYIDIGAWDDTIHSVTKHFYEMGWRGINVEPVKKYYKKLCAARADDINLNIAVLHEPGVTRLFEVEETGLSTSDPQLAEKYRNNAQNVNEITIAAQTLEQICEEHASDKTIDFLKIDTEGTEESVLKSGNWERFRPRVLIIESTHPNTQDSAHTRWESFVIDCGYIYAHFDGLNRFYVRHEDANLVEKFSLPPNIFDDFVSYSTIVAYEIADSLEMRLNSAMKKADKLDRIGQTLVGKVLLRIIS